MMHWLAVCLGGLLWLPSADGTFVKVVSSEDAQITCIEDQQIEVVAKPIDLVRLSHISDATCNAWIAHPWFQGYERRLDGRYGDCVAIDERPGVFCCPR